MTVEVVASNISSSNSDCRITQAIVTVELVTVLTAAVTVAVVTDVVGAVVMQNVTVVLYQDNSMVTGFCIIVICLYVT